MAGLGAQRRRWLGVIVSSNIHFSANHHLIGCQFHSLLYPYNPTDWDRHGLASNGQSALPRLKLDVLSVANRTGRRARRARVHPSAHVQIPQKCDGVGTREEETGRDRHCEEVSDRDSYDTCEDKPLDPFLESTTPVTSTTSASTAGIVPVDTAIADIL
jgi:hypothetical protein